MYSIPMKRNCLFLLPLSFFISACAGGGDSLSGFCGLKWQWLGVVLSVASSGLWLAKSITAMFDENSEDDLVFNAVVLGGLLLLNIYTLKDNFSPLLSNSVGGIFSDALFKLGRGY